MQLRKLQLSLVVVTTLSVGIHMTDVLEYTLQHGLWSNLPITVTFHLNQASNTSPSCYKVNMALKIRLGISLCTATCVLDPLSPTPPFHPFSSPHPPTLPDPRLCPPGLHGNEATNMAAKWRRAVASPLVCRGFFRTFGTKNAAKSSVNLRPEPYDSSHESIYTEQHAELRQALNKFIEKEINPFVEEWEAAKRYPAHELLKKMGNAGFLGVNKPTEYGGLGLDYSYCLAISEELGNIILVNFTKQTFE